jgi:hypothetical protein
MGFGFHVPDGTLSYFQGFGEPKDTKHCAYYCLQGDLNHFDRSTN